MPELNLWLIRHGESTTNIGSHIGDPEQAILTDKGHAQANKLIFELNVQPNLIITSPLQRTHETAKPIIQKWPSVPVEVWPIEEFLYLDPIKYQQLNAIDKVATINNYWQVSDPLFCDGDRTESFANFIQRVEIFHQRLLLQTGFVVVIGHGLFLKAFQLGLQHGFKTDENWMRNFRATETAQPMLNCEIAKLVLNTNNDGMYR